MAILNYKKPKVFFVINLILISTLNTSLLQAKSLNKSEIKKIILQANTKRKAKIKYNRKYSVKHKKQKLNKIIEKTKHKKDKQIQTQIVTKTKTNKPKHIAYDLYLPYDSFIKNKNDKTTNNLVLGFKVLKSANKIQPRKKISEENLLSFDNSSTKNKIATRDITVEKWLIDDTK